MQHYVRSTDEYIAHHNIKSKPFMFDSELVRYIRFIVATLLRHHRDQDMHQYEVEVTDTFGGAPNYSWVCRKRISVATTTQRVVVRAAKKALGYTGVRGTVEDVGDIMTFRPYGLNVIMSIVFNGEMK